MNGFQKLGVSSDVVSSLLKIGFKTPTPIQERAIPLILNGKDVLGTAQTGTGKTAAFGIPLVEKLLHTDHGSALVLTPTRELAKQVIEAIHSLISDHRYIKTALLIGGEAMEKQLRQLKREPRIIVGTPGRINDHIQRGTLKAQDASYVVLDEMDRMLDMGFGVQIDKIVKHLPEQRQTVMFSATLPKEIQERAAKYLSNPERVSIGATNLIARNINQDVIKIEQDKKYKELVSQLHHRHGSIIVFVKTKFSADKIAKKLRQEEFGVEALHGDLKQSKRVSIMKGFRNKRFRILVATDIASRGIDVPHIEHVINYDLPQVAEDYIHRLGRTARAGMSGNALCFVSSQDSRKWHAIEILLDIKKDSKKKKKSHRPSSKENSQNKRKRWTRKKHRKRAEADISRARSDKKGMRFQSRKTRKSA
jgi:superfamily II DNA/RNA helicase